VRRRDFITLLGGSAVAWPLAARAQQAEARRIGVLMAVAADDAEAREELAGFREGLARLGWIEGRTIQIDYLFAGGNPERFPVLAKELIALHPELIFAQSTPVTAVVLRETPAIPIVFVQVSDPIGAGFVASLNRPGGNATGVANMHMEVAAKRLGLLHELLPKAARFAVLVNPNSRNAKFEIKEAQEAGSAIGRQIDILTAGTDREIDMAFAILVQKRTDALVVGPHSFFRNRRTQLLTLAARHVVPTIFSYRDDAEAGGLMSYGSTFEEHHQVGLYTGRILKGERPANLPVMQASKFEFIINLQTAKALGINIPPTLLSLADEVVE
jgi:putative tryptophan/tyrosine transport system substrate-binding protein